ncbi:hypothetical protein FOZ62_022386, partial [Perkinsus olseni]
YHVGMTLKANGKDAFFDGLYSIKRNLGEEVGDTHTIQFTHEERPIQDGDLVELTFATSDDLYVKIRGQTLHLKRLGRVSNEPRPPYLQTTFYIHNDGFVD